MSIDRLKEICEDCYVLYLNDFLTIEYFAEYYGVSEEFSSSIINEGKRLREFRLEMKKKEIKR